MAHSLHRDSLDIRDYGRVCSLVTPRFTTHQRLRSECAHSLHRDSLHIRTTVGVCSLAKQRFTTHQRLRLECAHSLHRDSLHIRDYDRSVLTRYTEIHYTSETTIGVCSLATQRFTTHQRLRSECAHMPHSDQLHIKDYGRSVLTCYTVIYYTSETTVGVCSLATQ